MEEAKLKEWQLKRSVRGSSVDSFMSADSDGALQATEQRRKSLKKVSISPSLPQVIGEDSTERKSEDGVDKADKARKASVESLPQSTEEQDEYDSGDSLATLPSVRELASKFTPQKSPEPVPKKTSLKVCGRNACF